MVHVPAVSRKYIDAFLSYSAKTKRDGRTDGRTDRQTGGCCNISRPRPSAPREIKTLNDNNSRSLTLSISFSGASGNLALREFLRTLAIYLIPYGMRSTDERIDWRTFSVVCCSSSSDSLMRSTTSWCSKACSGFTSYGKPLQNQYI